jgi:hypothetical protein
MKNIFLLSVFTSFYFLAQAQSGTVMISHENAFYYEKNIYSDTSFLHTDFKPILLSQINIQNVDSQLIKVSDKKIFHTFFNENLIDKKRNDLCFTLNPIYSLLPMQALNPSETAFRIEAGLSAGFDFNKKWNWQTDFSLNSEKFISSENDKLIQNQIVPNYGKMLSFENNLAFYGLLSSRLSYSPSKFINLQLGYGKNFIGEGYRSLFLSENANSYPFFKFNAHHKKVQYNFMVASLQHIDGFAQNFDLQHKWLFMHYVHLSLLKRFQFGFFEAILSNPNDATAHRGLEVNYLNPMLFFRPMEYTLGSPDNALLGISAKLLLFKNLHLYAQLLLDEFDFSEIKKNDGYWANKFGIQAGFKAFSPFAIEKLFVQGELNTVRPFTYSHQLPITNYGHFYQSLAHLYGANFYEALALVRYSFTPRITLSTKSVFTLVGYDTNNDFSVGQDIFRSYGMLEHERGNTIAQGEQIQIFYNQIKFSVLLNPKWQTLGIVQVSDLYIKNTSTQTHQFFITLGIQNTIFGKENRF